MARNVSRLPQNGLQTLVSASRIVHNHLWENTFLTHFCPSFGPKNSPFSRHFCVFAGPKRATMHSKGAKNTCVSIPNGQRSLSEKHLLNPTWPLFWTPNCPFLRHLGILHGPKGGLRTPSKRALLVPKHSKPSRLHGGGLVGPKAKVAPAPAKEASIIHKQSTLPRQCGGGHGGAKAKEAPTPVSRVARLPKRRGGLRANVARAAMLPKRSTPPPPRCDEGLR